MDDYPLYSVSPNLPLLITLGLPATEPDDDGETETPPWLQGDLRAQATTIESKLPELHGDHAVALSRYLTADDVSGPLPGGARPWRGRASLPRYRYRVRTAGRTYVLPPRRAPLPGDVDMPEGTQAVTLHSPFSPLSPSCSLYPDGLLDSSWIRKHQGAVPSVFLVFYALPAAAVAAGDAAVRDDIAAVRRAVAQAGYKSRVAVAVVSEEEGHGAEVQERLEALRRGSGVESRLFFALSADAPDAHRVIENMLATLYGPALDYYRELGRHARKKRGRGQAPQPAVPPTRGTSQTLSLAGWQLRYDTKAGVLAELRAEPDAALRLYEQAYEHLVGGVGAGGGDWGLAGAIAVWSPRWNEARRLADVLAVRALRCLLLTDRPSSAARRWAAHRARMHALLDARGRCAPAASYGWHAWEARWACVMADLVTRGVVVPSEALFLRPEKTLLAERLAPWDHLHHAGYWWRLAACHAVQRRTVARALPDDDRRPPVPGAQQPPVYDDYMCPPPHVEYPLGESTPETPDHHTKIVVDLLTRARKAFRRRHQPQAAAALALEAGRELAAAGALSDALALLAPLWEDEDGGGGDWVRRGWTVAAEELGWTLRAAALAGARPDLVVAVDWELLDGRYSRRPNWVYDVGASLGEGGEETLELTLGRAPSFLAASFVFARREGKAGDTVRAQLTLRSNAMVSAPAIVLDALAVQFEGEGVPGVVLKHEAGQRDGVSVVDLQDGLTGGTDLTLPPQTTRVWELTLPLRAASDVQAVAAALQYRCAAYALSLVVPFLSPAGLEAQGQKMVWFSENPGKGRHPVARTDSRALRVLPRPPKLAITLQGQGQGQGQGETAAPLRFYTNEPIELVFALTNGEAADAAVQLGWGDDGEGEGVPGVPGMPEGVLVVDGQDTVTEAGAAGAAGADTHVNVPTGATTVDGATAHLNVPTNATATVTLRLAPAAHPATLALTLRAAYRLAGDAPAAPLLVQTAAVALTLATPFEANYDLLPRLHGAPWPSVFAAEGDGPGLSQAWTLVTRYKSFAAEALRVVSVDVVVAPVDGVVCKIRPATTPPAQQVVAPRRMAEAAFAVDVQKASLDHRAPVALDASFVVRWERVGGGTGQDTRSGQDSTTHARVNVTTLPIPPLTVFSTEPRVLAVARRRRTNGLLVLALAVVIENASNHFLTFGLSMEPSHAFAFSGAKLTTVHVLPVSRRTVAYRLVPLVRGQWLRPGLVVRDKYFQKVLRILPTEGMRLDKEGLQVWVGGEGGEEEEESGGDDGDEAS